jgi:CHAT domain-containing protein/tetratricopeptide (TPR) repeat protein
VIRQLRKYFVVMLMGCTCALQAATHFSPAGNYTVYYDLDEKSTTLWNALGYYKLTVHQTFFSQVFFSPDETYMAIGAGAGTTPSRLEIWSLQPVKRVAVLPYFASHASFSPDNLLIALNTVEGQVLVEVTTGRKREEVSFISGRFEFLKGTNLLIHESSRKIELITCKGEVLRSFEGWYRDVDPQGKFLVTENPNGSRIWNISSGAMIKELTIPADNLKFLPNGRLQATTGNQIILYMLPTMTPAVIQPGEGGQVAILNETTLALDSGRTTRIISTRTGEVLHKIRHPREGVIFSRNGNYMICDDSSYASFTCWNLITGKPIRRFAQNVAQGLYQFEFSPSTDLLLITTDVKSGQIWFTPEAKLMSRLIVDSSNVKSEFLLHDSPESLTREGSEELKRSHPVKAIFLLRAAVELDSAQWLARLLEIESFMQLKSYARAGELLTRLNERLPSIWRTAWLALKGIWLQHDFAFAEAHQVLIEASRLPAQPGLWSAHFQAMALHGIAAAAANDGQTAEAEKEFNTPLPCMSQPECRAQSFSGLANLHSLMGNYDRALKEYDSAIILLRHISPDGLLLAEALDQAAVVAIANNRFDKAESLSNESGDILTATMAPGEIFRAEHLLTLARLAKGKNAMSQNVYNLASNAVDEIQPLQDEFPQLFSEALLFRQQLVGVDTERKKSLLSTIALYRKTYGTEYQVVADLLYELGFLLLQKNADSSQVVFSQANQLLRRQIESVLPTLLEREKEAYLRRVTELFGRYNTVAAALYKRTSGATAEAYNNQLYIKGLLLLSSVNLFRVIEAGKNQELLTLYNQYRQKGKFLSTVKQLTLQERTRKGINVDALESEMDEMTMKIGQRSSLFRNTALTKTDWHAVAAQLKPTEAAIEIVRFSQVNATYIGFTAYNKLLSQPPGYMALIVKSKSRRPELVLLSCPGDSLEGPVMSFYKNSIANGIEDSFCYDRLWKPIQDRLDGITRIYLAPDGIYNQVNLETLYKGDKKFVIDQLEVRLLSNTRQLTDSVQQRAVGSVVLVGFPSYYPKRTITNKGTRQRNLEKEEIPSLPGTRDEIEAISRIARKCALQVTMREGPAASEEFLTDLKHPSILHIATHGFFLHDLADGQDSLHHQTSDANPLRLSGLLLANAGIALHGSGEGVLTAEEVTSLQLAGTQLVVLSACETGLGEIKNGEGVYGLQRAFQLAGANRVAISLWRVDDEATKELMVNFYEYWLQEHRPIHEAFRAAQLKLREQFASPHYWGAFIINGK